MIRFKKTENPNSIAIQKDQVIFDKSGKLYFDYNNTERINMSAGENVPGFVVIDNSSTNPFYWSDSEVGMYSFINSTTGKGTNPIYIKRDRDTSVVIQVYNADRYFYVVNKYMGPAATGTTTIGYVINVNTNTILPIDHIFATQDLSAGTQKSYMMLEGAQTVTGKKTFTTLPETTIAPTTNVQLTNKQYVDTTVAGIVIPTVPTKVSELENDSEFITIDDVPTNTSELNNDSNFITIADVPTMVSDLTNDLGFITIADVPTTTSELTNDSGFITESSITTHNASNLAHSDIRTLISDLEFVKDVEYDNTTGNLTFIYRDDTTMVINVVFSELFKSLSYDEATKELVITQYDDDEIRVSVADLVDVYVGSVGTHVNVTIGSGNTINATLNAGSIKLTELNSEVTNFIETKKDEAITEANEYTDAQIDANNQNFVMLGSTKLNNTAAGALTTSNVGTTITTAINLVGTGTTTTSFVSIQANAGLVSTLAFYQLEMLLTSLQTDTLYTLNNIQWVHTATNTVVAQSDFTFRTADNETSRFVAIPINTNLLSTNLAYAAGDTFTLRIPVAKSVGGNDTINIVSSTDSPMSFIRNGGAENSTNVLDYNGSTLKTQAQRNREYEAKDVDLQVQINDITSSAGDLGDIPILSLDTEARTIWSRVSTGAVNTADFTDNLPGGYILTGPKRVYTNSMFNRIKVMVGTPGWVRVGIVRGTGLNRGIDGGDGVARGCFKALPRYDSADVYPSTLTVNPDDTTADGTSHTTLKKWLVVAYAPTSGLYEYDFPDEIISSPFEYVYAEGKTGVAGFQWNGSGAAITVGDYTVADGTINTGVTWPTAFVTTTAQQSGAYALSSNMLDSSALIMYQSDLSNRQAGPYAGWTTLNATNAASSPATTVSAGSLNIGLYRRGHGGDSYAFRQVGNCITPSAVIAPTATSMLNGWTPDVDYQQILANKKSRIFAIELTVTQPGDLSVYVMSNYLNPTQNRILKHYTLRIRGIGPQRIHLPEEIVLQPGNCISFGGLTEAVSVNRPTATTIFGSPTGTVPTAGYFDTARFAYGIPNVTNWTMKGDDLTGMQSLVPYDSATNQRPPIGFRSWTNVRYVPGATAGTGVYDFSAASLGTNTSYLNITLVIKDASRSSLEGMNCSVTGDSISTYLGVINRSDDFGLTNNAAGNNSVFYPNSARGLCSSIDTTWWGALIKQTRMRLIRNDAWSGSRVTGTDSATSSTACASTIRTGLLHNTTVAPYTPNTTSTGQTTHTYGRPDIIFTLIGTNDLSGGLAPGAFSNTAPTDISTILGAFQTMVARHKANYPHCRLVYFMLPRGSQVPYPYTHATTQFSIAQMADAFEYIAKAMGAYFIPLSFFHPLYVADASGKLMWTPTAGHIHPRAQWSMTSNDALHPSAIGHQIIANSLQRYCENTF